MGEPGYDVRADTQFVARRARRVRVDGHAILAWTRAVDPAAIRPVVRPAELTFRGSIEELVRWTLLLDSLNFCFWTSDGQPWEVEYAGRTWGRYYALVASLHRAVHRDPSWLDPGRWTRARIEEVGRLFAGRGCIPMLARRVEILNEIGRTVVQQFGGKPVRLAEQAGFDAVRIACGLADVFESFRDVHAYDGRRIAILKRAQIFAADLAVALEATEGPRVINLESLTAFADYRVPQILRHLGILALDPGLERSIEAGEWVPASSEAEIEIRCCSIWAVQRMVEALRIEREAHKPAWMLDEYLWEQSHRPEVTVQHHRTLTSFY
ncbi:MAG: hypothetical protein HY718_12425 [Planctomycetes bacterium]|nr:hypothetical protein [Planctomycetota bacterium]